MSAILNKCRLSKVFWASMILGRSTSLAAYVILLTLKAALRGSRNLNSTPSRPLPLPLTISLNPVTPFFPSATSFGTLKMNCSSKHSGSSGFSSNSRSYSPKKLDILPPEASVTPPDLNESLSFATPPLPDAFLSDNLVEARIPPRAPLDPRPPRDPLPLPLPRPLPRPRANPFASPVF